MTRVLPDAAVPATPRASASSWRRRTAAFTVGATLVPLVGLVPVAAAEPDGTEPAAPTAAVDVVAPAPEQLAVDGEVRVGEKLTAEPAPELWEPAGVELDFTFQWFADEVPVDGAQNQSLTLTPALLGDEISVEITGTAPEGTADGATSDEVVVVAGTVEHGTFVAPDPTISGTVQVGKTLTARAGTWSPTATLTYRWLRSGTAISNATGETYVLTPSDHGRTISVRVTGAAEGYTTVSKTSASTAAVKAGTLSAGTPTVSGTVRVGSKVTAKPGTWASGTTFVYRWYASGQAIPDATNVSYTPTAGVKGKTLTVKVTGTKTGYATTTRTSSGVTVGAGVFGAATPRITGQVRTGATVSVSRGTWTPAASSYRYQWRVDGVAIRGATGSQYTIPSTYGGKKLSVTVTGVRTGYATKSVTSAGTTVLRTFSRTTAPTISGTARIGSTLKVGSYGTWTPTPSSWRYQWKANGVAIPGATGSSYKLAGAQYGKKITVTVAAVRTGYYRTARTSAATAAVAWPVGVSTPKVTSNPTTRLVTSGDSASFKVGATGGQLRYQWQVSPDGKTWTNLDGKTSATLSFTARTARDGHRYRAAVWNVAGKVYSKPATLWVDSTRSDPYKAGAVFTTWSWAGVMGSTSSQARSGTTSVVSAPMAVCYYGEGSAHPAWELDVEYVGSDGVIYDDNWEYFDDDIWASPELYSGGCASFTAYAVVPSSAVVGGTWRVSDWSDYPVYRQWVKGR